MKIILLLIAVMLLMVGADARYSPGLEIAEGENITLNGGYIHNITNGTTAQDAVAYSQISGMLTEKVDIWDGFIAKSGIYTKCTSPNGTLLNKSTEAYKTFQYAIDNDLNTYVFDGEYEINYTINIMRWNNTICGESIENTILSTGPGLESGATMIYIASGGRPHIKSLMFDGRSDVDGVTITGLNTVHVMDDVWIREFNNGLNLTNSDVSLTFTNMIITGCSNVGAAFYGKNLGRETTNCKIVDSTMFGNGVGAAVYQNTYGCTFDRCVLEMSTTKEFFILNVGTASDAPPNGTRIVNSWIESNTGGVITAAAGLEKPRYNLIHGNFFNPVVAGTDMVTIEAGNQNVVAWNIGSPIGNPSEIVIGSGCTSNVVAYNVGKITITDAGTSTVKTPVF